MSDLYLSPTLYGIEDVAIPADGTSFPARVYFPTDTDYALPPVMRPGKYNLIVFAHGARGAASSNGLCPEDVGTDYQRWEAVLMLLARCGFVIAAPELSAVGVRIEPTVERIATTVAWMRSSWMHAPSLWRSGMPDVMMREGALRAAGRAGPLACDGAGRGAEGGLDRRAVGPLWREDLRRGPGYSWAHASQHTRAKPCASTPQARNLSATSRMTGRQSPYATSWTGSQPA